MHRVGSNRLAKAPEASGRHWEGRVVVGTGSVGWMLLLGAIMAAEKNLPFGRRLAAPIGGGLLATALIITFQHASEVLGWATGV